MANQSGKSVFTGEIEYKMKNIVEALRKSNDTFDWIGFYIMNHSNQTLELGPFFGELTEHTIIPFGKGICGQVAVSGKTYHAPDVKAEDNYIACSLDTRSELVIPIYNTAGKLVAQLDIDSHSKNAFPPEVIERCEKVCEALGKEWEVV
jgi:L-methionine (R)-S-oxide reductase